MRLVFCWPSISGYMAACWRELGSRPGVEPFVVGIRRAAGKHSDFHASVMDGVPHHLLDAGERSSYRRIRELVLDQRPDVLFLSGWQHRPYARLAFDPALRDVRRLMLIDNAYRGDLRQRIGRIALRPYLSRLQGVFVPGERSWQYARWLGVPEAEIHRGTYGVDWSGLGPLWDRRSREVEAGWPRAFLFAGQYLHRKGIDLLVRAYAGYRDRVEEPWPLHVAGDGPEQERLRGRPGITDHGFVQPDAMAELRAASAAFVLPSRSDAWPLALVEACAAGLPVIASEACGSTVELLRPYHNGLLVPTGDVDALQDAMLWMHTHHDRLPDMGRASRDLAAAYSAERWADRVLAASKPHRE